MTRRIAHHTFVGLVLCLALGTGPARAGIPGWEGEDVHTTPPPPSPEQIEAERQKRALQVQERAVQNELTAAWAETRDVAAHGPDTVKLSDQAIFTVPDNFIFVPAPQSTRILHAYRTIPDANVIGIVVSTLPNQHWMAAIRYRHDGHVDDASTAAWNAETQLARLRADNDAANRALEAQGKPQREISGWNEPPRYDAQDHTLRWSLNSRPKNEIENGNNLAIYNVARFGRDGFYSVVMNSSTNQIQADKVGAETIIRNIAFVPGKTYGDFTPGTDPVAGYGMEAVAELTPDATGLATLTGGGFADHWKAILVVLALGLGAAGTALRLRRNRVDPEAVDA